jgi:capsular polysaccharide biosynthesis protein
MSTINDSIQQKELSEELAILRNRKTEYRIALLNPPPSLFVLEKAQPSTVADKPEILLNVIAGFILACVCAVLWLALIYAGKRP